LKKHHAAQLVLICLLVNVLNEQRPVGHTKQSISSVWLHTELKSHKSTKIINVVQKAWIGIERAYVVQTHLIAFKWVKICPIFCSKEHIVLKLQRMELEILHKQSLSIFGLVIFVDLQRRVCWVLVVDGCDCRCD